MATNQDTLWERFLKPIIRPLIDEKKLKELSDSIDWEKESEILTQPNLVYPEYYRSQNFHGIEKGYLNSSAAVTYDPITQYVLPPNETWVRQGVIEAVKGKPRKILDLGCGTGSTTILLKQAFRDAEVIGLDLSPYMLVMAEYKTKQLGLEITWRHGLAEATGLEKESFDLVTASLLFHETPPSISELILQECFRLLIPSGEVIILDGNQKNLRFMTWLTEVFEEPYIKNYAAGSVDAWMGKAQFAEVKTEDLWLIHQVTTGIKPIPVEEISQQTDFIASFA
jgi:ubiquinone/menaquinone biosynthesis C-methylase UbiE